MTNHAFRPEIKRMYCAHCPRSLLCLTEAPHVVNFSCKHDAEFPGRIRVKCRTFDGSMKQEDNTIEFTVRTRDMFGGAWEEVPIVE